MKKLAAGWMVLVFSLIMVFGTARAADPVSSANIRKLMGENFQHLSMILGDLIAARYQDIPKEVAVILDHADYLAKNIPPSLKTQGEKDLFLSYALHLKEHTSNLIVVVNELIKRDKERSTPSELGIDYLRPVVAEHFGHMITSCVLCHNQFRRYIVQ